MVDVMVVVDRQQDFAVDPVAVDLDVGLRGLGELVVFLGRPGTVETLDEGPDAGVFADVLGGEDAETVNGGFTEVSAYEEHENRKRAVCLANVSRVAPSRICRDLNTGVWVTAQRPGCGEGRN